MKWKSMPKEVKTHYLELAAAKIDTPVVLDTLEEEVSENIEETEIDFPVKNKPNERGNGAPSAWNFFRAKYSQTVRSEGFSGRGIASELGDRWRKLSGKKKKNYGLQAIVVHEIEKTPEKLDKSTSVNSRLVASEDQCCRTLSL